MHFLNYGENFIKWIKILFKELKYCVTQNGIFSDFFHMGRGCRQGDSISPYLFLLCAEIMGIMIRNNNLIKGIVIEDNRNTNYYNMLMIQSYSWMGQRTPSSQIYLLSSSIPNFLDWNQTKHNVLRFYLLFILAVTCVKI